MPLGLYFRRYSWHYPIVFRNIHNTHNNCHPIKLVDARPRGLRQNASITT